MDLKTLRKRLAAEAKVSGICQEWLEKIKRAPSREYLLHLFQKGLDFAILNDFPSDALAAEFSDIAPAYGIYINRRNLWTSQGHKKTIARDAHALTYTRGFEVSEVYALRGSFVEIHASDYAIVYATVYPGARLRAKAGGFAQIKIINRGGEVETETTEDPGEASIKVIIP